MTNVSTWKIFVTSLALAALVGIYLSSGSKNDSTVSLKGSRQLESQPFSAKGFVDFLNERTAAKTADRSSGSVNSKVDSLNNPNLAASDPRFASISTKDLPNPVTSILGEDSSSDVVNNAQLLADAPKLTTFSDIDAMIKLGSKGGSKPEIPGSPGFVKKP
jgi:hypothetical protein